MAKKKTNTTEAADDKEVVKGFTDHHRNLLGEGWVKLAVSRPRGKPHTLEEWMDAQRQLHVVKATDKGQVTLYAEQQRLRDNEPLPK